MSTKQKEEIFDEENIFDKSFKPLSHEDAVKIFGINRLLPIKNSWGVVRFQISMSLVILLLTILVNLIFHLEGVVISVIAGALFGVFPNIAFIITMQLGRDSYKNSAKKFVYTLICAELIKIIFLLIIMLLVMWWVPHLQWLPFLGMFIVSLQAHWLQGIKFKF